MELVSRKPSAVSRSSAEPGRLATTYGSRLTTHGFGLRRGNRMTSLIECRRGHAVAQGVHVLAVEGRGLEVSPLPLPGLLAKAQLLLDGVVQLGEAVGDLHSCRVELEAVHPFWILRVLLGERRDLRRELVQKGRLHEPGLGRGLEEFR